MLLGCLMGVTGGGASGAGPARPDPFRRVDDAMRRRLRDERGGALVMVHDRTLLHRRTFGSFRTTTRLPIASASKWLTAATLMTLVDDGHVSLDEPVSRVLTDFGGPNASITIRSLLSHTSGLPDADCVGDPLTTLAGCVHVIAQSTPAHPPGHVFHYSSVGYEVAARVIEVATGEPFERAFEDRIGAPVGMVHTRFDELGRGRTPNPDPAASAISTVDDWTRYLDMVLHLGQANGRQVLAPSSVQDIEADQVAGLDTRADAAVQITNIPTYGLGVWRDVPGPMDSTVVASGNGALGFYPWVDRDHTNFGIVAVDDERGPDVAVPASQRIARLAWTLAAALG